MGGGSVRKIENYVTSFKDDPLFKLEGDKARNYKSSKTMNHVCARKQGDQMGKSKWQTNGLFIAQKKVLNFFL
jgi:hypothetical protein